MPHDAQPSQTNDVRGFDATISRRLQGLGESLRKFETLSIRSEEEVKQCQRAVDEARLQTRESLGTDDLSALRGMISERMTAGTQTVDTFEQKLAVVEVNYNRALSGNLDQQA